MKGRTMESWSAERTGRPSSNTPAAHFGRGARILRDYVVTFFVNSLVGAIQRREPLGGQNA